MPKLVICPICERSFVTNRPHKKYCSLTCRDAGRILQRMKWDEANPHYNRDYSRIRRAKKTPAIEDARHEEQLQSTDS